MHPAPVRSPRTDTTTTATGRANNQRPLRRFFVPPAPFRDGPLRPPARGPALDRLPRWLPFGTGAGVSGGGILRDLALLTGGGLQLAYAAVFLIEVAGLAVALYALSRVGARELQLQHAPEQVLTQAGTLD